MDQERRLPAPARTPDDPERLARLRAEVWWNALTAPPARPRGRVYRPLYVLLLGWLFRERPRAAETSLGRRRGEDRGCT